MHLQIPAFLAASAFLTGLCAAVPVEQRPIKGKHAGPHRGHHGDDPFNKDFRDPYDHKIDTVAEDLQPLPIVRYAPYTCFSSWWRSCGLSY